MIIAGTISATMAAVEMRTVSGLNGKDMAGSSRAKARWYPVIKEKTPPTATMALGVDEC